MTQQDLDREFELLQEFIDYRVDDKAEVLTKTSVREMFNIFKQTGLLIWTDPRRYPLSFDQWKQNKLSV